MIAAPIKKFVVSTAGEPMKGQDQVNAQIVRGMTDDRLSVVTTGPTACRPVCHELMQR